MVWKECRTRSTSKSGSRAPDAFSYSGAKKYRHSTSHSLSFSYSGEGSSAVSYSDGERATKSGISQRERAQRILDALNRL
jgi:hypothetical protein